MDISRIRPYLTQSIILSAVFGLTALLLTLPVYAEGGLGVRVQPTIIDEVVDPGEVIEGEITVTNENGGPQTYYIETRNVVGMNDGGTPQFEDEFAADPLEAASWIQPLITEVILDVGETKAVPYRIVIPENASPGSHFAALFVTREAEITTESGAGVGFHVASLVNLRVSGSIIEGMQLKEFFTSRVFYNEPLVDFTVRVENTGTVHDRPLGLIVITNMLGKEVGQVKFNNQKGAILPQAERVFETRWKSENFALGKYTAIANLVYGTSKRVTITRTVTFWVIPLKEVTVVLGGIVLLLLVLMLSVRFYIRRALRRAGQNPDLSKPAPRATTLVRRMTRTLLWLLALLAMVFIGTIVFFV